MGEIPKYKKVIRRQRIWGIVIVGLLAIVHIILYFHSKPVDYDIVPPAAEFENNEDIHKPVPFDPNKADSLTLLYNGLKPWQIRNMMKYRAKGGRYRTPDDFRRLYGLTDSAFLALKPYIRIDSTEWVARRDSFALLRHERDSLRHLADSLRRDSIRASHHLHPKRDTIIELNATDTFDLQYIKGIGPYVAKMIIRYGNDLGGYVSPEQIREIKEIGFATFDSIIPHLTATSDSVKPIKINYCSVERLQKHPYISFTQAKAIYDLRRNRLKLKDINDLKKLDCLSDSARIKLAPYLSFEP